jgi:hypothetical protein
MGVPQQQVQVSVSPGSVVVVTQVEVLASDATTVMQSVQALVDDPALAAGVFGAPATVSPPTLLAPPPPPPPPPPPRKDDERMPDWVWALIVIGVVFALFFIGGMVVLYLRKRSGKWKAVPTDGSKDAETGSGPRAVVKSSSSVRLQQPRRIVVAPPSARIRVGPSYASVPRARVGDARQFKVSL